MAADDLPLILARLRRTHVARWWSDRSDPDEQITTLRRHLTEQGFDAFVMLLDGDPVGYLQCYDASPGTEGHVLSQPAGTRGIDLLIGEAGLIGQGHGPAFVRCFAERLFAAPDVVRLIADPAPANLRSIRCFEKAGFERDREIQAPWGPVIVMVKER